jgi:hypothetical protein
MGSIAYRSFLVGQLLVQAQRIIPYESSFGSHFGLILTSWGSLRP